MIHAYPAVVLVEDHVQHHVKAMLHPLVGAEGLGCLVRRIEGRQVAADLCPSLSVYAQVGPLTPAAPPLSHLRGEGWWEEPVGRGYVA
jgi:hypothetical protein